MDTRGPLGVSPSGRQMNCPPEGYDQQHYVQPMSGEPSTSGGTSPAVFHNMQPVYHQNNVPYTMTNHQMPSQSPNTSSSSYGSTSAQFKVNMWQNRPFDSGVHSMQHSQAPSMMSMHASSQMSAMSVMEKPELTDQQQQKFENISMICGPSSSDYGKAVRAVPELMNLLLDEDATVVLKALSMMTDIAKMDEDNRSTQQAVIQTPSVVEALVGVLRDREDHPKIIYMALGTLFRISCRQEGMDLLFSVVTSSQGEIIRLLVKHVRVTQINAHKYALLTLHTLFSDRKRGGESLAYAKDINTLEEVRWALEKERSCKLLSVIVDLVRLLCRESNELRNQFFASDGIMVLLYILQNFSYENLLFRTTHLLKVFSNTNPQALVGCGVPLVISRQLCHPSQQVVQLSLECLRNLSDVCPKEHHMELLSNILQLFKRQRNTEHWRQPDTSIVLHTAQTLLNICANNKTNKEFLVSKNIVAHLLSEWENHPLGPHLNDDETKRIEELHETLISTLRVFCIGHSQAVMVQSHVFERADLFLDKLVSMRPLLLKQTLFLLNRLCGQNDNLPGFRNVQSPINATCFVGFPEQITHILKISCMQLLQNNREVEGVRLMDLMMSSMNILQSLCRDVELLERICFTLMKEETQQMPLLPVFVLQQNFIDDEALKKSALSFVVALMAHPRMVALFEHNHQLKSCLMTYVRSNNRELAALAEKACRTRMLGGAPPVTSYPVYPQRPMTSTAPPTSPAPEPMDGAGDQFTEADFGNLAIDDNPLVNVFCNNNMPQPDHLMSPQGQPPPPQWDHTTVGGYPPPPPYHPPPPLQHYPDGGGGYPMTQYEQYPPYYPYPPQTHAPPYYGNSRYH